MHSSYLFTSESVSAGHPDKIADQISDAVLDAYLARDPYAKVACETLVTKDLVVIAGEVSSSATVDIESAVRDVIRDVGYDSDEYGFSDRSPVEMHLHTQSPDIRRGVDRADGQLGAGDQGMMFGYAVDETPELMPLPIMLAHRLLGRHAALRKKKDTGWLRPDAKSQVTVQYIDGRPREVQTVVLSTQHSPEIDRGRLEEAVVEEIIKPAIPEELRSRNIAYYVNPTGSFTVGGPAADTGVTGRKIIVDTYGGACPHGGGAFSGKDPTKVDRSGAYAARYAAKNIVAAGLATRCTIQVSYAIGVAEPVSVLVDSHGTGRFSNEQLADAVKASAPLRPGDIIERLGLRSPFYRQTASGGHFGRAEFPWEKTDLLLRPRLVERRMKG